MKQSALRAAALLTPLSLLAADAAAQSVGARTNGAATLGVAREDARSAVPPDLGRWTPLGEPSVGGRVTSIRVSPHDSTLVLSGGDMLGVARSTDSGARWGPTFGFDSWEVGDLTWHPTDPDVVWAGTMGGPYVSLDAGVNWEPRRTGFPPIAGGDQSAPVERILFDPNNSARLVAVGGSSRRWRVNQADGAWGAVWESLDAGNSWTRRSTLTAAGSSTDPAADGEVIVGATFAAGSSTRLVATVDGLGVYVSNDGGTSWSVSNAGLPHTAAERIVADATDPDVFLVSLSNDGTLPGGVFRSSDGGASWSPLLNGLPQESISNGGNTSRYQGFAAHPATGRLLAFDDRFGSTGGYLSDDGGLSWAQTIGRDTIPLPYPSRTEMEVAEVAPGDPDVLFAAGSANFVRSVDGGATWSDAANVSLPGGRWRGTGYSGLVATEIAVNPWNTDHWIAQGFDGARVLQSLDGGATWTFEALQTGSFSGGADAVFASRDIAYANVGFQAGGYQGLARTFDGGLTWDTVAGAAAGLPEVGDPVKAGSVHASPAAPLVVWAVVDDQLLRSTDGGSSWSVLLGGAAGGWITGPADGSVVYLSTSAGALRSFDGVVFESIGGPARPGKLALGPDGTLWNAAHDRTGNLGLGLARF
ncbi:MAG: sialidase family protein, partial [Planctomycetota bacterium]